MQSASRSQKKFILLLRKAFENAFSRLADYKEYEKKGAFERIPTQNYEAIQLVGGQQPQSPDF